MLRIELNLFTNTTESERRKWQHTDNIRRKILNVQALKLLLKRLQRIYTNIQ